MCEGICILLIFYFIMKPKMRPVCIQGGWGYSHLFPAGILMNLASDLIIKMERDLNSLSLLVLRPTDLACCCLICHLPAVKVSD